MLKRLSFRMKFRRLLYLVQLKSIKQMSRPAFTIEWYATITTTQCLFQFYSLSLRTRSFLKIQMKCQLLPVAIRGGRGQNIRERGEAVRGPHGQPTASQAAASVAMRTNNQPHQTHGKKTSLVLLKTCAVCF